MTKELLLTILLTFSIAADAQQSHPSQQYKLITGHSIIAAKNYYLLTLLQENKAAEKLIENDKVLTELLQHKSDHISTALKECKTDLLCFTEHIKFSEDEISQVSSRLAALYNDNNALGDLVKQHLIPSGTYVLFQQLPAKELLVKAWEQDAHGINFAIAVYAEGKKANYPLIDSIGFKTADRRYTQLIYNALYAVMSECSSNKLFFVPSLTAALQFLDINERSNASDYEPMNNGENKAAIGKMKILKWDTYKYSLIMIPGAGPDDPLVPLSAEGMIRCRLAAVLYKQGLAPFIVTSGGKVHPYKTKYCEAIEMKRYLIETLHIPASAILIDPHARHTTTNMRNTVRLIYRYGMPFNKPALTCTTRGQSNMIETTLIARCIKELNEAPYKNGVRLNETAIEFYPLVEALHINPAEPMDP